MKSARVRKTSLHDAVTTTQQRVPTGGCVRGGIQRLIQSVATKMPEAVTIYNEGVAAGASFDDIGRALSAKFPAHKGRFMVPQNVPYFRVVQSDFTNPVAAQVIMDSYAEDRNDGNGLQLYSFPIVFPSDDLDMIFREQFEAWRANELFRWSEPDPASGQLMCMRRAETAPDKAKRRRWGGRPTEAVEPCDPNNCALFAKGDCKHVGTMHFWIPGVSGVAPISLTFTSVYASMGIAEIIELVRAGLGRVKGLWNGKPIFRISKRLENVSVMDWEKGKATRRQHHIIHLEADGLDMVSLLTGKGSETALAPPAKALAVDKAAEDDPVNNSGADDHPIEEEPTEVADTGNIQALRERLGNIMKALDPPWGGDDLLKWLEENGHHKDSVHDEAQLEEIIGKLSALLPDDGGAPF